MYKPLKIKRKSRVEGNMDSLVNKVRAMAKEKIIKKHNSTSETLDIKVINDIIYNEKAHIVSVFKDYLIYDDNSEFMKRFYKTTEARSRLPKIFEYYETYSKIFPNYINLEESKYIYKNIQKKQKMIDNLQKYEYEINQTNKKKQNDSDLIFNTQIYNSIMNQTKTLIDNDVMKENYQYINEILTQQYNNPKDNSLVSIEKLIDTINVYEEISDKPLTDRLSKRNKMIEINIQEKRNDLIESRNKDALKDRKSSNFNTINQSEESKNTTLKKITREKNKISHDFNPFIKKYTNLDAIKNQLLSSKKPIKKENDIKQKIYEASEPKYKASPNHKNTLSMPKLTNNIFFIISQNPVNNNNVNYITDRGQFETKSHKNSKVTSPASKLKSITNNTKLKTDYLKITELQKTIKQKANYLSSNNNNEDKKMLLKQENISKEKIRPETFKAPLTARQNSTLKNNVLQDKVLSATKKILNSKPSNPTIKNTKTNEINLNTKKLIESLKSNPQKTVYTNKKTSPLPLTSRKSSVENDTNKILTRRVLIDSAKPNSKPNPLITATPIKTERNELRLSSKISNKPSFHIKNFSELTKSTLFTQAPNSDRSHHKKTLMNSLGVSSANYGLKKTMK